MTAVHILCKEAGIVRPLVLKSETGYSRNYQRSWSSDLVLGTLH